MFSNFLFNNERDYQFYKKAINHYALALPWVFCAQFISQRQIIMTAFLVTKLKGVI